jgi:hypothetical protein
MHEGTVVSIANLIPALKGTGSRRAVDEVEELRAENVALLTRQAAADEHFMVLDQLITGLEGDKRELQALLAAEQGARAVAEMDVETRGRWIADLESQVADLQRRLDIRGLAEAAAARTQELDVRSLRERFTAGQVVTLHHSPQAAAEPEPAA